jgi:hypothetical protein
MKALDKFIEENGFRGSQSVKVGYDSLKEFINQRVIEELEDIVDDCIHIIREPMLQELLKRIKELKQE